MGAKKKKGKKNKVKRHHDFDQIHSAMPLPNQSEMESAYVSNAFARGVAGKMQLALMAAVDVDMGDDRYVDEEQVNGLFEVYPDLEPSIVSMADVCRNDFTGNVITKLIDAGGWKIVNQKNPNGISPLTCAVFRGNSKGVKALFDGCEKYNVRLDCLARDLNGTDIMFWAGMATNCAMAKRGEESFVEIIDNLRTRGGIDVTKCTKEGRTAGTLTHCLRFALRKIARFLIEVAGADVNEVDNGVIFDIPGQTPLCAAIYSTCPKTVNLLLEKGANTRIRDSHGFLPICQCFGISNMHIARIIMKHEEESNINTDDFGEEEGGLKMQMERLNEMVQSYRKTGNVDGMSFVSQSLYMSSNQHFLQDFIRRKNITQEQYRDKEAQKCAYCGLFGHGSSMKKCIQCENFFYCNRNCQKAHWKKHKKSCIKA